MKRGNVLSGLLLILVGSMFLSLRYVFNMKFFNIDSDNFWPVIVLIIGMIFELIFFVTKSTPILLIPGGILTVLGLLFFFEVGTHWNYTAYSWPVYIYALSFAMFQYYLCSSRRKGILTFSVIITALAVIASVFVCFELLFTTVNFSVVISVIAIAAGLILLFGKKDKKSSD